MSNQVELAVFGHVTRDYIVTCEGDVRLGELGGGGPNAAAGAAYWCRNGEVGLVCKRAANMAPEVLQPIHGHTGLNAEGLRVMPGEGIKLWLLYDMDGYRHWVLHHDSATRLEASPVPQDIPQSYLGAKGYHFAPLPPDYVLELVKALPAGKTIQLDPHYEWFFPRHMELWRQLLPYVTILTPSEDEFTKFWDIPYGQPVRQYAPYMRRLADMGPQIIVLKIGAAGALLYSRKSDSFHLVPPWAKDEDIVDVTGAGDTFCGSFFVNILGGRPLLEAAVCGMVGSAITMELHGVPQYFAVPPGRAQTLFRQAWPLMQSRIEQLDV